MGEDAGPPWYMVLFYAAFGITLTVGVLLPFIRRLRRRTS